MRVILRRGLGPRLLPLLASFVLLLPAPATASHWVSIGPRGPGTPTALVFAPSAPNVAYAGTYGGGVARSVDGGKTWTRASHGLLDPVVTSLAVDPGDADFVLAATARGLSRSHDGGRTWRPSWDGNWVLDVTFAGSDIVIGTRNGIFRSSDGGVRWVRIGQDISPGEPRLYVPAVVSAPSAPRILYAAYWGARTGVFVSANGGQWWRRVYGREAIHLAVDPRNPQVLYAGGGLRGGGKIARTKDGGLTWQETAVPANLFGLWVDPLVARRVYATTDSGLWISSDGGAHWAAAGFTGKRVTALALDPEHPDTLLCGVANEGISRSEDGAVSWLPSSAGLVNTWLSTLAIAPDTGRIYAAGWGGVYRTDDSGGTWTPLAGSPAASRLVLDPRHSSTLYATGSATGAAFLARSTDSGETWTAAAQGITRGPVVSLAVDPVHPQTLYAGAWDFETELYETVPGVFKSTDGGATWTVLPLRHGAAGLAVDPQHPATVFATQGTGVYRSADGGQTWSQIMNGDVPTLHARLLGGLAVSPVSSSVLAAYDDLHVFVTRDGGRHWTRIPGFGLTPSYNAMAFDPLDERVLFVGGANGVARLSTETMELRPEDGDLFNLFVTGFAFDPAAPGSVYVSTLGGGVLKSGLSR